MSARVLFIWAMRALASPIKFLGFVLFPAAFAFSWHSRIFARQINLNLLSGAGSSDYSASACPAASAATARRFPAELGVGAGRSPWRYSAADGHAVRIPLGVGIREAANL